MHTNLYFNLTIVNFNQLALHSKGDRFLFHILYLIFSEFIKMCYYSAWAAYRDGDQALKPEDVDAFHCTHLALAYGTIDDSGKRVKFPDIFEEMHL